MKNKYLVKITSLMLALSMIFGLMLPVTAAWDGYTPPGDDPWIRIADFDRIGDLAASGLTPSGQHVEGERFSIRWKDIKSKTSVAFKNVPRNWTDFSEFKFSVYTEKPNNGTFVFVVYTDLLPRQGVTSSCYATAGKITLNHTGWKEFRFLKEDFADGNASGWDKVTHIAFVSNWSGTTKTEDSDLCISSVYASTAEPPAPVKLDASPEGRKAVIEALGDNIAVMNFSNNAVKNGEVVPIKVDNRITTDESGQKMARFGFFESILGATFDGEKSITLDGKTVDISDMIATYDNGKFLYLEKVLAALDKTVSTHELLTIIGDKERSEKIFDDPELLDDLKFMLHVSVLTNDDFTKADWQRAKDKWIEYLVGEKATDLNDPNVKKKLATVDRNYEKSLAERKTAKESGAFALFGKTNVSSFAVATSQIQKLRKMAIAYATYGSKYYKSVEAHQEIMEALKWFYENMYGLDEIIDQGWKSVTSGGDSWSFRVGLPPELGETILLLGNDISVDLAKKYMFIYEMIKTANTAGNLYTAALSAVLHEDYDKLVWINKDYVEMMAGNSDRVNDVFANGASAGVKEDGLFITHKFFAYTSAYGSNTLFERLNTVEAILAGTEFEFINPYKYMPMKWLKNTFEPVIFNGAITSAQSGRFRSVDSFSETSYIWYTIAAALDLIGCFGKDDDIWLKNFVKRNFNDANKQSIMNNLNSYQTDKLNDILKDDSIQPEDYFNTRVFYTGDSVTHQKGDFGFAIAMSSSRIAGWESITGQNHTGWYQGDGMLYTYLKNDVPQYDRSYWKFVNPYHLPGTTVDTQPRVAASINFGHQIKLLPKPHFVGGVQFDDDYAVAAMQLEGLKIDTPNANIMTADPGGDPPSHYSSLEAKKAWFLFDDEAVALGTDINANDGFEVQTIIENRKLNKTEKERIPIVPSKDGTKEYEIIGVTESNHQNDYVAANTLDGEYATYWGVQGDQYLIFELEEAVPIGYVGIMMYNADSGSQAIFELETSVDGINWTTVWEGKASGKTNDMEAYNMKGTVAKYIKYNGHGRTRTANNIVSEVRIFGPSADGTMKIGERAKVEKRNDILGAERITVDGNSLEKASNYKKEFANPNWMHIETVGGYFFPTGGSIVMDKVTNEKNFLEVWFTHGVSPKDSTYSYVVLPTMTKEETASYAKAPDIEILSNTEKLQVVREKTLGLTGLVFWEAGKFDNIETSVPMIMMVKEKDKDGIYRVNLSDPTKLLKEGKVTIKGNYDVVSADERMTVTSAGGETVVSINFDSANGRTLPLTLLAK